MMLGLTIGIVMGSVAIESPPYDVAFISRRDGNWEIYTMRGDGGEQANRSQHPEGDHAPRWTDDGRSIVFRSQRSGDGYAPHRMLADGTSIEPTDGSKVYGISFLPDGVRAVRSIDDETGLDVYIEDTRSGERTRLTHDAGENWGPTASPDGSLVLFSSNRDGNTELYLLELDGNGVATRTRRLTETPSLRERYASFSPDGTTVLYSAGPDDAEDGAPDLYTIDVRTGTVTRLTDTPGAEGECSYSPDGAWILFQGRTEEGDADVFAMLADGTGRRNLTSTPGYDGEPVWCPVRREP